MRHDGFRRAWGRLQGVRATVEDVGHGVRHIRIRSRGARLLGFDVSAYLVDRWLIDTGFAYAREPFLAVLGGRRIEGVCCTHSHEDHTGNAAAVAAHHHCPVFLRNADSLWGEGVRSLAPYRRIWWGPIEPFAPEEMPEAVGPEEHRFEVVPAGGHSRTHVALFDGGTGDVFTGDLYLSGGAAAILIWGDPWQEAASLRRVAALKPRRALTGHGEIVSDPAARFELKADRIEEAAGRAVELTAAGLPAREVVRRVFPRGIFRDRFFEWLTSREFSRLNFVRAAVQHAPSAQ